MKRRKHPAHVNHERWLVSYADFITLLFAFFVVLYAAAEVDKRKAGQIAAAIQVAFQQMGALPTETPAGLADQAPQAPPATTPAPPPKPSPATNPDLAALKYDLQNALAVEIQRGEVALRATPDGLVVSLREGGFFESGSAGLKAGSQPALRRMAELLGERSYRIRIEGHTDNIPIHNSQFSSNWELSTARATEMVRLLITQYQIPPAHLSAAGYGEYHPTAPNETADGRAQNRRVDVVILDKSER